MSKVLAIFLKDVRHLWPQVLVFFAAAAMAVVSDPVLGVPVYSYMLRNGAPILEAVACWVLIVAVIHEERLIGHEQYWLTRPYTWKNLVAAKALFLAAFISLPLFVCQWITLEAIGSMPDHWMAGLLWRQLFLGIFVILPAVALAAVTSNMAQVLLCVVVGGPIGLFALGWSAGQGSDWGGLAWIRTCATALAILAGVAAVVVLQYTRRRTAIARILVAATCVLATAVACAPRWGPAFAVQRLFARQYVSYAAVSLSIDASATGSHPPQVQGEWTDPRRDTRLDIPVRVRNVPPGLFIGADWVSVTVEAPGAVWHSKWLPAGTLQGLRDQTGWMRVHVDPDFYHRWKATPVKLSAVADLTLYQHVHDALREDGLVEYPDTGICGNLDRRHAFSCSSPFLQLTVTLEQGEGPSRQAIPLHKSFAPFPTQVGFRPFGEDWPYSQFFAGARVSFDLPVAFVQRRVEATQLRMKDLVTPP